MLQFFTQHIHWKSVITKWPSERITCRGKKVVFYRVEPLGCTNRLARIQKKHKNDQAREMKKIPSEKRRHGAINCWYCLDWSHCLHSLKCLHCLYCFHCSHCLLHCLSFLNNFETKRLLCLCKIWLYCFLGLGAKIGVDWMEWVIPFRLLWLLEH